MLTDTDPEVSERAAWGLGHGVPPESRAEVGDAVVRLLASRSDPYRRDACLELLKQHGSARHVPDLEVLLASPGLTAAFRRKLEQLIAQLRRR